jgi:hypothetical protein
MANKIISLVLVTEEQPLDSIITAAVEAAEAEGHQITEVRVSDDSGETVLPIEPPVEEPPPDPPLEDPPT